MSDLIYSPQVLPINSAHVALQFARRQDLSEARFILDEIALRMLERLQYIKMVPEQIVDAGCGPGLRYEGLHERYPKANYIGVDSCVSYIQAAQEQHQDSGLGAVWRKLGGKKGPQFILADMATTGLAPESAQLVWSNLALHWHPEPHRVIAEWRRLLQVGGLCMFSCFGPSSLIEVRTALAHAGIQTGTMPFVDMHDFGDILLEHGFMDPVMDQELITLTYKTPEKLLEDVYHLGGNPVAGRAPGLRGREWYQRLLAGLEAGRGADGLLRLTLEVAYGHAWRSVSVQHSGETRISISSITHLNK